MKWIWAVLLMSGAINAQIAETIAIQGVMQTSDQQTVKDINTALKMIRQMEQNQQDALNQINGTPDSIGKKRGSGNLVSKINYLKSDIYSKFHHNYQSVSKQRLNQSYLKGYTWDVGPAGNGKYYIEIKYLNKSECNQIVFNKANDSVLVNNSFNGVCADINNIKLFF